MGRRGECKECFNEKARSKKAEYNPDLLKECSNCGEEKKCSEFYKRNDGVLGVASQCKKCKSVYHKEYSKKNSEKLSALSKDWRRDNPGRHTEYMRERRESDPVFKTEVSLRSISNRLKDYKDKKTIELVGCSPEEFWRRNGSPSNEELKDLDIDHIVPLSWFDLENEEHKRVACSWTNLQYLNSYDNRHHKRNKYAGTPDAILGYRDEFDLEKHVTDMVEFLNDYNLL